MTFDHGGLGPLMVNPHHGSTKTYTARSTNIDEIGASIRRLQKEQDDAQKVNEIQQRTFVVNRNKPHTPRALSAQLVPVRGLYG
jgi:hypothetical protein